MSHRVKLIVYDRGDMNLQNNTKIIKIGLADQKLLREMCQKLLFFALFLPIFSLILCLIDEQGRVILETETQLALCLWQIH